MLIGVPKEIKNHEYRVGLTPASARELIENGHSVIVETNAGVGSGFLDGQYESIGAKILSSAKEIFAQADMIVKVKEPQPAECEMLREGQILFTYLHLAPDPEQTKALLKSGVIAIAYETITDNFGRLPLLAPMSEVAGRMSIQAGAAMLEKSHGGSGVLLSGVSGVAPGKVCILGGGVVGMNAARVAVGMGARVTILDRCPQRLRELDLFFESRAQIVQSNVDTVKSYVRGADLVVGAVLVAGAHAPRLVTREDLSSMRPGSVLVDVSIDQGGCFETSHATTHDAPSYVVDGIVHYCVANMPGAVARTSTVALNNSTLPYTVRLANDGYKKALSEDVNFRNGLNVFRGKITHKEVADYLKYDFTPPMDVL